ncbi:hypothetical protein [Streptomyces sp. NPDC001678]|uniref:hypothetical protein n=1 Tax=Streptomyces sp. NPDC001678 TaxID=3364599 RepID=UPI0036C95C9A
MSSWRRAAIAVATLVGLLAPAGTATAGQGGTDGPGRARLDARVIGTLEDGYGAHAVNRNGEIVFRNPQGESMVWNLRTGEHRTLQGGSNILPSDITDDGRVVGIHGTDGLLIWDADGTPTRIGVPAGQQGVLGSSPRISDDGTVLLAAYHYVQAGPRPRTVGSYYRWRPETGFRELAPMVPGASAAAIDDEGLIVGSTPAVAPPLAAAWRPDGTTETYAASPGHTSWTWAKGVNNREVLVGGQRRADGVTVTPTRWDDPANPEELTDLGFGGEATGINDRGWITGSVRTDATGGGGDVPVVWDPRGGLHRLDESPVLGTGSTPVAIEAINDRDQLLVRARKGDERGTPFLALVQLH